MPNPKSSTTACPECGQRNRAGARFCEACAARLGSEPSIASTRAPTRDPLPRVTAPAQLAASGEAHGDSRFDAPRTVHSRPMPLPEAGNSGFWFKFCMAGLAVMIGFIAWSLYMLTGSKAPTQLPAAQVSAETPPAAASAAPASPSVAPVTPPVNVAPSPKPSTAAAADTAPRSAMPTARAPQPASNVPPAAPRPAPEAAANPPPQRQAATRERERERVRRLPSEVRPADFGGWVEPSRPPAMTSAPNYQDAGPPIVPGPGPREPLPMTSPAQPAGSVATTGRQDVGPPVTAGPGPRYDYSTPNAVGR